MYSELILPSNDMYLLLPEFREKIEDAGLEPNLALVRNWLHDPTPLLFAEKLIVDKYVFECEKKRFEETRSLSSELIIEMKKKDILELKDFGKIIEKRSEEIWSEYFFDFELARRENSARLLKVEIRGRRLFDVILQPDKSFNPEGFHPINPCCLLELHNYFNKKLTFEDSWWRRPIYEWKAKKRKELLEAIIEEKFKNVYRSILEIKPRILELKPKLTKEIKKLPKEKRNEYLFKTTKENFEKIIKWRKDSLYKDARKVIIKFVRKEIIKNIHKIEGIDSEDIKRKFIKEIYEPLEAKFKEELKKVDEKVFQKKTSYNL